MIREIKGDLFSRKLNDNEYYVHCISQDFKLGAGIAKVFRQKYQSEYSEENIKYFIYKNIPIAKTGCIYNLITKPKYWNKPTLNTLENSLAALRKEVIENNIKTLVMPKIGCGLDRFLWNEVRLLIDKYFSDIVDVEIYYL